MSERGCEMENESIVNRLACVEYAGTQEVIQSYKQIYSNLEPQHIAKICYGCACDGSCADENTCVCLAQYGFNYDNEGKPLFLVDEKYDIRKSKPVFECNSCCSCPQNCPNRVVQRGLRFKVQVFKTLDKGYGVLALENISKRSYLVDYAGEVLKFEETLQRLKSKAAGDNNYLLTVQESYGDRLIRTDIDAGQFGNVSRFINHSCDPNLLLYPVRIESVVPSLALFAKRDITPGEELTFDYSGGLSSSSDDLQCQDTKCRCLSDNCKGFLPTYIPRSDAEYNS